MPERCCDVSPRFVDPSGYYSKNAHMSHTLLGVSDVTCSCEPEHRTQADCCIETKAALNN